MPDIHRRVKLLVTAVDELFGTHTVRAPHQLPEDQMDQS